jgi:uncharacterized protein
MKFTETKDGIVVDIFVKPNSPKFEVKIEGDEIIVRSTEEPEKGKVNKEIIKEFTKLFRVKVEIVSGLTSKQKKLFIEDLCKTEAEEILLKQVS